MPGRVRLPTGLFFGERQMHRRLDRRRQALERYHPVYKSTVLVDKGQYKSTLLITNLG